MPESPLQFGPYTLGEKLRDELLASVYAATSEAGTRVELHILAREHEGNVALHSGWVNRAESLAAARPHHVVRVDHAGIERGRAFYAVAPTSVDTLATYLGRHAIEDAEAASLCRQVAEALGEAHSAGVSGWDLRPDSIRYDPRGGVLLTRWLSPMPGAKALPSGIDQLQYQAPERSNGRQDETSDVYAAGVLLLRMIAGRDPTPQELDAGVIPAGLTSDISNVLQRCLERDPDARFPNANELAIALTGSEQTVIISKPVNSGSIPPRVAEPIAPMAMPPPPLPPSSPSPKTPKTDVPPPGNPPHAGPGRHRGLTRKVVAITGGAVLVVGAGVAAWLFFRPESTADGCPVKDGTFCDFARDAASAARSNDTEWFSANLIRRDCNEDSVDCTGDACVDTGLLGSEGGCVTPDTALQIFHEKRLFGVLYPSSDLIGNGRDGPSLLLGEAEGQLGTLAVLQELDGEWKIAMVVNMYPSTLYLYKKPEQIAFWPPSPDVNAAWLGGNSVLTSTSTPRSNTPLASTPTPIASPTRAAAPPLGSGAPYAAIVARVEPDICARQRQTTTTTTQLNIIQCIPEGEPVALVRGPENGDGRLWWYVTARDGRQGWMAEEFLMLTTQTIPVGVSDSTGNATLRLDAVDIQPGGDLIVQLAFTNNTSSTLPWQSDDGRTDIFLTDESGQGIPSVEAGGSFGRPVPAGLPPGATLYGWHRFRLSDLTYRGHPTLNYPNHGGISFDLSSAR